ncbi:MAG: hypothetical protein ISQ63_03220 [SAR86 cluster bacterium]|uniref:Uncharacterized protein n=1 Tax=SAR86 cluster bacterium TaxID=2030880 RepID=A0A937LEH9_9GAMM|nr:hypothetical protein [Gammaproteobacteria bacterium]MBL6811877.1 hypothetical protein [SAR86 cluster bacterium]|tara:strand:- start:1645 stop:2037 length:393 start_codon:yes stop_codon:yes gene_type:complete
MREVLYLLKILVLGIFFSGMVFTKNIILDCEVTLVGIEGKDKASNNTEIIDINLKAKTIFFGTEAIPYKLKNKIRVYEGIYFKGNKRTFAIENKLVIDKKSFQSSLNKNVWDNKAISVNSYSYFDCKRRN